MFDPVVANIIIISASEALEVVNKSPISFRKLSFKKRAVSGDGVEEADIEDPPNDRKRHVIICGEDDNVLVEGEAATTLWFLMRAGIGFATINAPVYMGLKDVLVRALDSAAHDKLVSMISAIQGGVKVVS
ncbi:MAG: hypothetical protein V2G41_09755 [bacterium JZ-2024 1]